MSADLFAEFGDFSTPPPQPHAHGSSGSAAGGVTTASPFAFLEPSATPSSLSTTRPPPQRISTSGTVGETWGSLTGLGEKPGTEEEDDENWGDFEVAGPAATPAPE